MKRVIVSVLTIAAVVLTGCAGSDDTQGRSYGQTGVNDVLQSQIAEEQGESEETSASESAPEQTVSVTEPDGVDADIDLTSMSANMVYATVYDMMSYPGDYIGKTICMNGLYDCFYDEVTGTDCHACVILDATACCAQGLEFIPPEDYDWPNGQPNPGDEITVIGTLNTFMVGEDTYIALMDAHMV